MALNQGYTYQTIVDADADGLALLAYLTARFGHSSEMEWRERVEEGLIRVDGEAARTAQVLARGQVVAWARPPWEEPNAPLAFAILYEDADLLAVAKPSGLPTNPGGGFLDHTLLSLVRRRDPTASPIHRLGRGTSGLVLFSRNQDSHRALTEAMRARELVKVYRALAVGHPAEDAFTMTTPIGPVPHATLGTVHAANLDGRPARSHARVLERRSGTTLLEVRIETGRPHQIRIHLAAAGHPLVGDPLYAKGGLPIPETRAVPGDLGYFLHAHRLGLNHPRTGAWLDLECQPPSELRTT